MTSDVLAVVLAHDEPEYLRITLEKLEQQTLKPTRILVVDTSKNFPVSDHSHEIFTLPPKTNFASAINSAVAHADGAGFLWILHDDSAPEPDALRKLMHEVELSPSLAVVGPKQLVWENPKLIKQLGLTLTRSGRIFNRVAGDFDQGQHDYLQDVLAVGSAGALINLETFRALGGFDSSAPPFAAELDFCMRARLAGFRVAVAPQARIQHAALAQEGVRSWGFSGPRTAVRRAEWHLGLSFANPAVFVLAWLFAIPSSLISSLGLLLRKRVGDIPAELAGACLAFLGVFKTLASRSKIARTTTLNPSILKPLRASRAEVKQANQRAHDEELSRAMIEAHARGDQGEAITYASRSLTPSALFFALVLALLNFSWFPTGVAITGAGVIPLGASWLEIFDQAGSNTHVIGLDFIAPADPWVWALAILSAPTFFEPTLAITIWTYLSSAIAFLGAFALANQFSRHNVVRIVAGLAYALWPSITFSLGHTNFAQLLAQSLLPWLFVSLAKIASIGRLNSLRTTMPWSQLGIAAALLAIVGSASPITGIALVLLLLLLAAFRYRRAIPLLFVSGLLVSWWLPPLVQAKGETELLSLLLPPGADIPLSLVADWRLVFMGFGFDSLSLSALVAVAVLPFALVALLESRFSENAILWGGVLLTLATGWVASGISFNFQQPEPLDLSVLLALAGLLLAMLFARATELNSWLRITALVSVVIIGVIPASYQLATNPPEVTYSSGRLVPSLVQAEAEAGSGLRSLQLSRATDGTLSVSVFSGDGIALQELSTRYRLSLAKLASTDSQYQELGQLVANLSAGNGVSLVDSFNNLKIGFVLVSPVDKELQLALDGNGELESIGVTDFGQLWKVREGQFIPNQNQLDLPLIKLGQLAALGLYVLLSIPSGFVRRRTGEDSTIFVDQEETA